MMNPKKMFVVSSLAYAVMLLISLKPNKDVPQYRVKHKNPVQVKIERYIKDPYIAEVISKRKRPYLLAAIKLIETEQAGPYITGDDGDSIGMFQVQPRHWNKVEYEVSKQVIQCEKIVEFLIDKHGISKGIERYNGSGRNARHYSKRVIDLAAKIEKG